MRIDATSPLEQHATWLATNPVLGCPKDCQYCFLKPEGLNGIAPKEIYSVNEILNLIPQSPLYTPEQSLALGTRTDMFATPKNVDYLHNFLDSYELENPLVLITKCLIQNKTIQQLQDFISSGHTPLVFLSYSGLDRTIEKGINHNQLRSNFKSLKDANIPTIHYWRPFMPQNSNITKMENVANHASKYASASIIDGLRMTPAMIEQFSFWPEIQEAGIELEDVESIYTKEAQDNFKTIHSAHPHYPLVYATSCAIANTLGIPDYNGVYGTEVCAKSNCPPKKRDDCSSFHVNRKISPVKVEQELNRLGINSNFQIEHDSDSIPMIRVKQSLPFNLLANLTQTLKARIIADSTEDNGYGWGGHHNKKRVLTL